MKAAGTTGPHVADFFETNLRIPAGPNEGQPFALECWQREAVDIIYEVDERGLPMWKQAILGIPRGNGKSPLCGGLADYEVVEGIGSPQVFCTAAARTQAGIVHMHANKVATGGPLDDYLVFPRVREALGPIKCPHNDGILRVLSADGDLQQGLVPKAVFEDELHTFKTAKQVGLHFAMTTAMHKRNDSRMVIITTAGSDKDSLLGELVDAIIAQGEVEYLHGGCLTIARDYEAKRVLIWYGAPEEADVDDPAIWRACNPASWIADEELRIAHASNPESEFRRYYLNQWVLGDDAVIQPDAWDACKREGTIPAGAEVWAGVDLGEKRDTAAVVIVAAEDDGVRVASKVFVTVKDADLQTALPLVEGELRRLADTYYLRAVNFDAWQMRDMAARLASEGMPMREFPQDDTRMVPASALVFDLITDGKLHHDGDPVLRSHILSTASKPTARGGWRFSKPKSRTTGQQGRLKQNDATIALAMACAAWRDDNQPGGTPWLDSW